MMKTGEGSTSDTKFADQVLLYVCIKCSSESIQAAFREDDVGAFADGRARRAVSNGQLDEQANLSALQLKVLAD
jgi:hypothetical protein